MPHFIIEHSTALQDNVAIDTLQQRVMDVAIHSKLFSTPDIKVRAMAYDTFLQKNDLPHFLHVVIKLLEGRTLEQRQQLASDVFESLQDLNLSGVSLSVELVDLEKATYFKS